MTNRPGGRADELLADWADVAGRVRRPIEPPSERMPFGLRSLATMAGPMVAGLAVVLAVGMLSPGEQGGRGASAGGRSPSPMVATACPVTAPNGAHGGAWPATPLDHGEQGLFTALWPDGTVRVPADQVGGTGVLWMDFLFHRDGVAAGPIRIEGRRIGAAPSTGEPATVQAEFPDGNGDDAILRVDLGFPAEGCWEISAASGAAELRFVTRVERSVALDPAIPSPSAEAVCPVTAPNGVGPADESPSPLRHGIDGLSTILWPDGTVLVPPSEIEADGALGMKFVFFREGAARGALTLSGRRLDGVSEPMRADIPDGYGTTGIQATGLHFPAEGCWEVTATSGAATLTFVTRVRTGIEAIIDHVAPEFRLQGVDGVWLSLSSLRGRPVALRFWSTWCPPCADDLDLLADADAAGDIQVLSVAVRDDPDAVRLATAGRPISRPTLLDPEGRTVARYGGSGLPLTLFIDGDGIVRSFEAGPLTTTTLAEHLAGVDEASAAP